MDESVIKENLEKYTFYHVIRLTENIETPGISDFVQYQDLALNALRSLDLNNKRVLDIGCRDGLFSFEAEKLGAQHVIGIDNDLSPAATEFLIPYFNSKVQMYEMNLFDLTPETFGKFDVVILAGVLYHLRYPFWGLKLIKDVLVDGGQLVIETVSFVDDDKSAMLYCPTDTDCPAEPTSISYFNMKGLRDTLGSLGLTVRYAGSLRDNDPLRNLKTRWQLFLARPARLKLQILKKRLYRFLKRPRMKTLDHATLVCSSIPQRIDSLVSDYWNGTHRIHTNLIPLRSNMLVPDREE